MAESNLDALEQSLLYLSPNPIRFEPVNKVSAVFFDETNKQIFTVRSGGATGVVTKGLQPSRNSSFRMEDRGPVISIKFSPDQRVLAIQRTKTSVEFVNCRAGTPDGTEYSQPCRSRSAAILDFVWVAERELVFVTDRGVEHYQVLPERRQLKQLKTVSLPANWCVYSARFALLLVSTGPQGSTLQPFAFRPGLMTKLAKFEVEVPSSSSARAARLLLHAHDVTLCELHGALSVLVLQHGSAASPSAAPGSGHGPGAGAHIQRYVTNRDGAMVKNCTLLLGASGSFAISVIDNLILVHHQESKTSQAFDISSVLDLPGDRPPALVHPCTPAASIAPFHLPASAASALHPDQPDTLPCPLYAPSWVVFQPNIVIDAKLGCFWTVQLRVSAIPHLLSSVKSATVRAVQLLLARTAGRPVLLKLLKQLLLQPGSLSEVGEVLDLVSAQTQRQLHHMLASQMGAPVSALGSSPAPARTRPAPFTISQQELHVELLQPLLENMLTAHETGSGDRQLHRWVCGVLVECIRSLTQYGLAVEHFLYEMLLHALLLRGSFYPLQQLLQYHVIADSKPLACLLLSLQSVHRPACQMGLDMLHRLGTGQEEIVEVLLSRGEVVAALRYARDQNMTDSLPARKFLDVAKRCGDDGTFFSTFKFFEERNYRTRGKVAFAPAEQCEPYVKHFSQLFGTSSSIRIALEAAEYTL